MSRSDGEFPGFERIDLNPEEWPDEYWDSNRRCRTCSACWPDVPEFTNPPCHPDTETIREGGAPDMRWPEAIRRSYTLRFERFYDEWNEGKSDEQLALDDVTTDGKVDEVKVKEHIGHFLDSVAP